LAATTDAGPPAWSPNGTKLAFVDAEAGLLRIVASDGAGEERWPLLDQAPGATLVAFSTDAPPSWAPDGREVAFITWDGNGDEVYVVEVPVAREAVGAIAPSPGSAVDQASEPGLGPEPKRLSDIPASTRAVSRTDPRGQKVAVANAADPAWSPDGRQISFTRLPETPGSTGGLTLMAATGGRETRVTKVEPIGGARWSPNGEKLLFGARREGQSDIYIANLRGFGLLANLTRTHPGLSGDPDWSPDGRRIAFASDGEIWLMGADGGGKRRLVGTELRDHSPAWSPDGSKVAFVSEQVIGE